MQQNLTLSLERETIRKAKILAARRMTSLSRLVAAQIDALASEEEAYERAESQALALLDHPYRLGFQGIDREQLHER